jgi:hypothetical protein
MIVLNLVKTALRLRAITLLLESSYIEIGRCNKVVFRWVSYFIIKEIVIVVSITIDLL